MTVAKKLQKTDLVRVQGVRLDRRYSEPEWECIIYYKNGNGNHKLVAGVLCTTSIAVAK
jgi:hypothetical protein